MKRTATATVLGIILVGAIASIAAINTGSPPGVPELKGRAVILNATDRYPPPAENVRYGIIGKREFIVVPVKRDDGTSCDYWKPLDEVTSLRVFDNMEEAVKYHNARIRSRDALGATKGL